MCTHANTHSHISTHNHTRTLRKFRAGRLAINSSTEAARNWRQSIIQPTSKCMKAEATRSTFHLIQRKQTSKQCSAISWKTSGRI